MLQSAQQSNKKKKDSNCYVVDSQWVRLTYIMLCIF